uniref:Kinesin-like protein n=1 Tax=Chromera velia CCMP2878 TaxID=1169474 RepID=A0A0G4FSF9_9ALVE|mmetsp:Transcript_15162/g.30730  ORF Transcript_15162/g.30730 Transcript_15162/m.30730 type:complete len:838 (+) Transcript_15162:126-2639(+)|eukprot:Cvel_18536.t1-p1 / transcript=Cvel_18536.t1 / gene=Cvel_18536 / organism=Chromera_velia_CCMP2878 / gene_product=Kinesin heavy chain, putative / transcript_product=Kinesin heavy chain, putative / location=Cvel_scaffold1542:4693-12606(+) / protein_length=837 / sequence_SO=supercontig / SO=protein_coding / is_pseudo=false
MASNVKVVARFRPLNEREQRETGGALNCTFTSDKEVKISGTNASDDKGERKFNLDRVFPPEASSRDVYDFTALPIVEEVLKGYNGTVFAYGQTGSGKTFTMEGVATDPEKMGVIPRMVATMFEAIDNADEAIEFTVKCSIVEIYMERVRDLLDPTKDNLKIHEDKTRGIYIGEVTEEYVTCEQDVFDLLNIGHKNRSVAATNMNAHSSRSHLLFIVTIQQKNMHDLSLKVGKLYLVDLAGSEKVGKTGAEGSTLDEAKMINKSLSALGNVINALTDPKVKHIPYRDSKLTRILTESLGGNAKTCLMVACSPSLFNEAETVSTLRFGMRAKSIKNNAKINQERSVEELKLLLEKAEATIAQQRQYIVLLEKTITDLGGKIPEGKLPDGAKANREEIEETKKEMEADEEEQAATTEKMIQLMDEIVEKREELRKQSDHISELKREYAKLQEKLKMLEEENSLLVNRVADQTVASEQAKYDLQEMSDNHEQLQMAKKNAETELQVIRENHKQLLDQLTEKDSEIENLSTRLQNAVSDLAKLKTLIGSSANDVLATKMDDGDEGGESANAQVARITTKLHQKPPTEAKKVAADVAAEFEQQSKEELIRQVTELQRFKLFAVEQMDTLKEQNATLRGHIDSADGGKGGGVEGAWAAEREKLNQELTSKASRLVDLEMALLEERERFTQLKATREDGERPLKRKVGQLDRNLEQLTIMYHKLVSQNSGLKVECQVNEKKLARKEQRIANLEKSLETAKAKYEKLLQQCANLTSTVESMYKSGAAAQGRRQNMQKPLRGGGQRQRGSICMASADHAKLALEAARQADEDAATLEVSSMQETPVD